LKSQGVIRQQDHEKRHYIFDKVGCASDLEQWPKAVIQTDEGEALAANARC
jgi:hypothetical protein